MADKSKRVKKPRRVRTKKPRRVRTKKPRRVRGKRTTLKPRDETPPPGTDNPFQLVMYHVVRIPWYIVKTFDWLFTLFTALLVYLTK